MSTKIKKFQMNRNSTTTVVCKDGKSAFDVYKTARILNYGGNLIFQNCENDQEFVI